jgi:hypothetical protein
MIHLLRLKFNYNRSLMNAEALIIQISGGIQTMLSEKTDPKSWNTLQLVLLIFYQNSTLTDCKRFCT